MKVLILGKTGQLGQALEEVFLSKKDKVFAFSHSEVDIENTKKLEKTLKKLKPDVVINATAFHVVPECESNPDRAFAVNTIAVKNLAKLSQNIGASFVHYSTDYVFWGTKGKANDENELPFPRQTYGVSKLAGEFMALNYNSNSIVIRASGVYGGKSGSRSKKGNFVLNILKEKERKTLEVSAEQIVNPTYAPDLAEATSKLVRKRAASGIYHLNNEGYCSWAEFTAEIMKLVGSKTKVSPVDRSGQSGGARRPLFSALKNKRAAKLGIKLPTWQNALKRYLVFLGYATKK